MRSLLTIAALGAAFVAGHVTATGYPPQEIWYADHPVPCDTDSDCQEKNPDMIDGEDPADAEQVHADAPAGR